MTKGTKEIYKVITTYLIKVIIAGFAIGLLYKKQELVAIILGLRIIYRLYKYKVDKISLTVPIIGMLVTGTIGTIIEYYGTKYNHWEYHNISTQLPKYLFFVWMLAFTFMYNIERKVYVNLKNPTKLNKLLIVAGVVILFPTVGEIICINLGVWTYYAPYMFLGVSPYSIGAIAFVHLAINYVLSIFLKKTNIKDVILNPS